MTKITKIESPQNDHFKKLLSLTTSKGLKKEGLFLLSGEKLIHEFLENSGLDIVGEITFPALTALSSAPLTELSADLFAQIDVLGTHYNILVVQQPVMGALASNDLSGYQPKGIEVVIPVGDPGNLGALIRSCEAFATPRVILTQEAAHPFLPKSVKASAGSVLRISIVRGPALQEFPASCMALDMDGMNIGDFEWPSNGLLVVGEEGQGIGKSHFKQRIRIPTAGVESLNAVVAASIALAFKAYKSGKSALST